MAYDIRLVKIVTGELVVGKYDEETGALKDVAIMQRVPTQQGVQMMILPYGYPFEQECCGKIEPQHFLFEYAKVPQDVQDKYIEICSHISMSSGGLNPNPAPGKSGSGLIL